MDQTKILTRDEIQTVIKKLRQVAKRKSHRSMSALAIFRLSCCCGLRSKEIRGLSMSDFAFAMPRPAIRVRAEVTKGREGERRQRVVPLWWDRGTYEDLKAWHDHRKSKGAGPDAPFLVLRDQEKRLSRNGLALRWQSSISVLGKERVKQLSIHCGRRSFCSHALFGGRTLVEVQRAAGHRNVATTSRYLGLIERDQLPDLFD